LKSLKWRIITKFRDILKDLRFEAIKMTVTHVVALGGSLLRPEEAEKRRQWLGQLRQLVVHLEGNGRKLGIVVGGGLPAREGIELAKNIISDSYMLDEIGIAATRLNATVLQQIFLDIGSDVSAIIPKTTEEASNLLAKHSIVVMGGTKPGHTTDAVAIALARDCGARNCIIATNVDYVYDKDPREHEDAKPMFDITIDQLADVTGTEPLQPGQSAVVDPIAVGWAKSASIDIAVLDGRNISLLDNALDGKEFNGTLIRSR
jgi:uridylate kinase